MRIQLLVILLVCCSTSRTRNVVAFVQQQQQQQQHGNRNGRRFNLNNVNINAGSGGGRLTMTLRPTTTIRSQSLQQEQAEEEATSLVSSTPSSSSSSAFGAEASRLQEQAQKIRLEAQQLDMALTSKKIEALEAKINNPNWLAKNPDEASQLTMQLQLLQDRLLGKTTTTTATTTTATTAATTTPPMFFPPVVSSSSSVQEPPSSPKTKATTTSSRTSSAYQPNNNNSNDDDDDKNDTTSGFRTNLNPLAGFDDADLKAFVPVAQEIDARMTNATMDEKREAFRSAPELQDYFQKKIQSLLVEPLQEMKRLEELKRDYLESTSKREKESLKRHIEKLEQLVQDEGIFVYSDSIYCDELPQLSEQEVNERLQAVGALPETLQSLYKHRVGVEVTDGIRLAIEVEHYGPQLQLLEQIKLVDPIPDEMRQEFIQGYNSMPVSVQEFFIKGQGLKMTTNNSRSSSSNNGGDPTTTTTIATAEDVLKELERTWDKDENWSPVLRLVEEANAKVLQEPIEYEDIEFVDRSRFLQEFFPAVANMEDISPDIADVEQFVYEILSDKKVKKAFMMSSKPERVSGGYYIRGTNLLEQNEEGNKETTASDQLVQLIQATLDASSSSSSSLRDKIEFFYILDPSPLSDEDIEMENTVNPILLVTAKNPERLYDTLAPLTKAAISLSGAFSILLFSIGACALNPVLSDRFTASLDAAAEGTLDLQWLADLALPTFLAICFIQLAHELAHRAVGWKDKFDVGMPNLIPGVSFGITGAITTLRSPPPNLKSLFDFAIAGPLVGILVSFLFLVTGLAMTASMDPSIPLPVMPVDVLRSSSLIGGMSSFFLGNSALLVVPSSDPATPSLLGLHPFAIAGVVGLFTNALALLPVGHTDGGRISLTMFGRRGSFVVQLFTTPLLFLAGILGWDTADILLTYALFTAIWQRQLETPVRNEVDELDFSRGLVGIGSAVLVGLILLPML